VWSIRVKPLCWTFPKPIFFSGPFKQPKKKPSCFLELLLFLARQTLPTPTRVKEKKKKQKKNWNEKMMVRMKRKTHSVVLYTAYTAVRRNCRCMLHLLWTCEDTRSFIDTVMCVCTAAAATDGRALFFSISRPTCICASSWRTFAIRCVCVCPARTY
jgi:hypothetical protein